MKSASWSKRAKSTPLKDLRAMRALAEQHISPWAWPDNGICGLCGKPIIPPEWMSLFDDGGQLKRYHSRCAFSDSREIHI
jgi:hypothetical protein